MSGRRDDLRKAIERIAAKYHQIDKALGRAGDKHAHDYRTARDATLDVLTLVIAGHLTDHGMGRADAAMAARQQAAELIEQRSEATP